MEKASKKAPKKKAANGYKLAAPLPVGEILEDKIKKKWVLGPSIGQGGFGAIYSAKEAGSNKKDYPYVVKIEPHENGPLFVEMHFYTRNAKPDDVQEFQNRNKLKTFGMPCYLGSGSHERKGEKLRFVVMEKFGSDIWKLYEKNGKCFPAVTVFRLAIQILDVLEFIHERGYVHADIKGANILMGLSKETVNKQVYLVDFGLATKFDSSKEFKPNPKKAHDGTIEYLSRDAHLGVQTRRGDLEILAYNLIHWLGGKLPWEKNLLDPVSVQKSKEESMKNITKFLKACFGNQTPSAPILSFLNYIKTLDYNEEPDYKKIRKIFTNGIKDLNGSLDGPLMFSTETKPTNKRKSTEKLSSPAKKAGRPRKLVKEAVSEDDTDNEEVNKPKPKAPKRGRPKKIEVQQVKESDNENLNGFDSEEEFEKGAGAKKVLKKTLKTTNQKVSLPEKRKSVDKLNKSMEGYNQTMKEILLKKREREANKQAKGRKVGNGTTGK